MKKVLLGVNALLLLAIVAVAVWPVDEAPDAVAASDFASLAAPLPPGGGFTLEGPNGAVSLADFRGRLVVLYFGYTYCPDICPTSLSILGEALNQLAPDELARVQPLFVSVDPQRDDAARLAEYAPFFHPAILGLSGAPQQLREIITRYGGDYRVVPAETPGGDYVVDHSAQTTLVSADGEIFEVLAHGTPPQQVVAAIRRHLPPSPSTH